MKEPIAAIYCYSLEEYFKYRRAIERDTPRPVRGHICPSCDSPLFNLDEYCSNCGQRVDWSNTDGT